MQLNGVDLYCIAGNTLLLKKSYRTILLSYNFSINEALQDCQLQKSTDRHFEAVCDYIQNLFLIRLNSPDPAPIAVGFAGVGLPSACGR